MELKKYLQEAATAEFSTTKKFIIGKNGEQIDRKDITVLFNNKKMDMVEFIKLLNKKDEDALLIYKAVKDKAKKELDIKDPTPQQVIDFIATYFKAPNGTFDIMIRKGKPVNTDPSNIKRPTEHKVSYDEDELKAGRVATAKEPRELKPVPRKTIGTKESLTSKLAKEKGLAS